MEQVAEKPGGLDKLKAAATKLHSVLLLVVVLTLHAEMDRVRHSAPVYTTVEYAVVGVTIAVALSYMAAKLFTKTDYRAHKHKVVWPSVAICILAMAYTAIHMNRLQTDGQWTTVDRALNQFLVGAQAWYFMHSVVGDVLHANVPPETGQIWRRKKRAAGESVEPDGLYVGNSDTSMVRVDENPEFRTMYDDLRILVIKGKRAIPYSAHEELKPMYDEKNIAKLVLDGKTLMSSVGQNSRLREEVTSMVRRMKSSPIAILTAAIVGYVPVLVECLMDRRWAMRAKVSVVGASTVGLCMVLIAFLRNRSSTSKYESAVTLATLYVLAASIGVDLYLSTIRADRSGYYSIPDGVRVLVVAFLLKRILIAHYERRDAMHLLRTFGSTMKLPGRLLLSRIRRRAKTAQTANVRSTPAAVQG